MFNGFQPIQLIIKHLNQLIIEIFKNDLSTSPFFNQYRKTTYNVQSI